MNKIYKNEPCPECGNFTNRGLTIDAVIVKDGAILLIRRRVEPFKGYWATPGGYVGWDETVDEVVKREVKEETNLDVNEIHFVGVYSLPDRHPNQAINLLYLVKVKEGEPIKGDDAEEVKWFSLDSLPPDLAFDHSQNIKDALGVINKTS